MGSQDDNLNMPTHERAASLATSKASANRVKAEGASRTEGGQPHRLSIADAQALVETWPEAPKKAAEKILDEYGPPNEATPTKMFWYRPGRWSRMELTADEAVHNFPTPHTDYLTQYIDYPVPAEKAAELIAFDGSVLLDRTTGELGARCDHEAYNTLTINLAAEIIAGTRTVEDARRFYAETAAAFVMGRPAPYAEGLLFDPAEPGTAADPDERDRRRHGASVRGEDQGRARDGPGPAVGIGDSRPDSRCPPRGTPTAEVVTWPSLRKSSVVHATRSSSLLGTMSLAAWSTSAWATVTGHAHPKQPGLFGVSPNTTAQSPGWAARTAATGASNCWRDHSRWRTATTGASSR